jgi:hypothetical protein
MRNKTKADLLADADTGTNKRHETAGHSDSRERQDASYGVARRRG